MQIHAATFALVLALVAATSGALLLLAWWQHRETAVALWWAAAHLTLGLGVFLLAFGGSRDDPVAIFFGMLFTLVPSGLIWTAARQFAGRRPHFSILLLGPSVWLVATIVPSPLAGPSFAHACVQSIITVSYYGAAALELRRVGQEIRAVSPLIAVIVVQGLITLIAVPLMSWDGSATVIPAVATLSGLIYVSTVIFIMAATLFVLGLMKERSALHYRNQANTDFLTGLPNRRAFMHQAERLIARCRTDRAPISIITFDLDHFKAVNDTYGHSIGDATLQVFAERARNLVRPGDLISRIGGEEFAAILPGASLQAGYAMAERIRKAFAEAGLDILGHPVGATTSSGVTTAQDAEVSIEALLERADAALYKAKLGGRNRVECAEESSGANSYPRIVRVA